MKLSMEEWKESVISSRRRLAIPLMTHPGISLTGHSVLAAVTTAQAHFEAVKAVTERYPTAAATMIMDLSAEAEAFGAEVRFEENEVPCVSSRAVDSIDSIEQLKIPDVTSGRLAARVAALKLATRAITDRPVFAECIGPFSLAGRLYDVAEIMTAILTEPDLIMKLVGRCTQFLVVYCQELKFAGANGVVIAEPVAGMLSPELCTEFSSQFVKKLVLELQDKNFAVVLHNCGETDTLVSSMVGTGASCLHFGNKCNLVEALRTIPPTVLVLGNIDPVGILKMGTPEDVRRETALLLQKTAGFKNFVLSSGCDVPPGTTIKNIDAFFEALDDFNNRSQRTSSNS